MTDPNIGRVKRRERTPSLLNDAILFLAAAAAFATLLSIFGPTLYLVDQHHAVAKDLRAPKLNIQKEIVTPELDIEADVEDLDHEELFQATIKSCLPEEEVAKCKQFIPTPIGGDDDKKVQRVAFISPPGDISDSFLRRVKEVVYQHNQRQKKVELNIELIETSHVPPYGYGKTHGLTKVLRLVPQPLILEVTDALENLLEPGETHAMVTLQDVKAATRQIIRFHCRLSHLAAHTAIMSVDFMDLLTEPADVMSMLHSFLVSKDTPEKSSGEADDDEADDALQFVPDDDENGLFDAKEAYGTQMLSHIQSVFQVNVNQVLDQVLLDELDETKNLTAWPCQSFWTAGDAPDKTKLSPITQRLAKKLSPDCEDPYASCFVKRDKCEARGDGICKEQHKKG